MSEITTMVKSITSVQSSELKGKRVIVRCDFNIQVFGGKILDDLRIRKTLPTISYLRNAGAKIILISHIESKDGTGLKPVCEYMNETYAKECGVVMFVSDFQSENMPNIMANMKDGEIAMFENLRIDSREKNNDIEFAKLLASYADIYVNDAFAVSHRAHASVVSLPSLFPNARFAGVQLMSELDHLKITFDAPHPFVFILGGAKFETKLPLIQKFAQADSILLGGALLNDILKAKGYNVGKSLVSSGMDASGTKIDFAPIISNPKLIIPDDVVVAGPIEGDVTGAIGTSVKLITEIGDEDAIMDVGPSMNGKLADVLKDAKFILWNGPMGNYEKGFKDQTIAMAKLVTSVCERGVEAVLGGGDTTAAMAELDLDDKENSSEESSMNSGVSAMFISTGGGAMLEYLLNETLPGVEALKN
ncbi:MAG: phosphoglycerate kinase [Candidatus Pacebacteria bacterium]|nr:phosphoglycerate kinase [Candidatus Paceibacterota bacterium]